MLFRSADYSDVLREGGKPFFCAGLYAVKEKAASDAAGGEDYGGIRKIRKPNAVIGKRKPKQCYGEKGNEERLEDRLG